MVLYEYDTKSRARDKYDDARELAFIYFWQGADSPTFEEGV